MAILISYKVDFRAKRITKERGTLHNNKWVIHLGDIILNVYAPNNWVSKCMDQPLIELKKKKEKKKKTQIESCSWCQHLFFSNRTLLDQTKKQIIKTEKFTVLNQLDLMDIYITHHSQQQINTLLKYAWNIHQQDRLYLLGQKHFKFKITEII